MLKLNNSMKLKKWQRINSVLRKRKIHHDQIKHINCIRIHATESKKHFMKKAGICYDLFKQGHDFLTEAWTTDRKQRFDILDLTDDIDIEIETGKSKKKRYKADVEYDI